MLDLLLCRPVCGHTALAGGQRGGELHSVRGLRRVSEAGGQLPGRRLQSECQARAQSKSTLDSILFSSLSPNSKSQVPQRQIKSGKIVKLRVISLLKNKG